jgi:hypothetical protein
VTAGEGAAGLKRRVLLDVRQARPIDRRLGKALLRPGVVGFQLGEHLPHVAEVPNCFGNEIDMPVPFKPCDQLMLLFDPPALFVNVLLTEFDGVFGGFGRRDHAEKTPILPEWFFSS